MDLLGERLQRRDTGDYQGRLSALEEYVEYLRQQGEYGLSQAGLRLERLERDRS